MMNRITLIAAFCLMLSTTLLAQPLTERVPGDAVVYIGWQGTDALKGYEGSNLEKLAPHSTLGRVFTEALPEFWRLVGEQVGADETDIELSATLTSLLWKRPSAIYFGPMDLTNPRKPQPRVALLCDAGADAAAVAERVRAIIGEAARPDLKINVETDGTLVIFTVGSVRFDAGDRLNRSEAFAKVMDEVQSDAAATVYVNVAGIVESVDAMMATERDKKARETWPKVRDALALKQIKAAAWSAGFAGKDWSTRTFVWAPAPRAGLAALGGEGAISDDLLKLVPQDATYLNAFTFDVALALKQSREVARKIGPDVSRNFERALGGATMFLGKNLQNDVLEPLGAEWAIYYSPQIAGASVGGFIAVNKLDDPAKAEQAIMQAAQAIANGLGALPMGPIKFGGRVTEIDGLKIYYLGTPLVAPAWAIQDGTLYVGLYPQFIASAAREARQSGKSILDNPAFVKLRGQFDAKQIAGLSFNDLPKSAELGSGYQALVSLVRLLGVVDMFGGELPEPVVPPLHVIRPLLSVSGSVSWLDDEGYHVESRSPFPGSELLSEQGLIAQAGGAFAGTAIAAVLLPSMNRAQEMTNQMRSVSNLRQIGMCILLFSNENKGKYPDDLGELLKSQDVGMEVFVSPRTETALPGNRVGMDAAAQAAWVNENSDYVYLGKGMTQGVNPETVVAYENSDRVEDGINLLFGDGHVEFLNMDFALDTINRQAGEKADEDEEEVEEAAPNEGNAPQERQPAKLRGN